MELGEMTDTDPAKAKTKQAKKMLIRVTCGAMIF
jgi:hypothetical protein